MTKNNDAQSVNKLLKHDNANKQSFNESVVIFYKAIFRVAIIKALYLLSFTKVQMLAVTTQYLKRKLSKELRAQFP